MPGHQLLLRERREALGEARDEALPEAAQLAGIQDLDGMIEMGASPRASLFLTRAAKANAFLQGRSYATPHDVKNLAMDVMRHRVVVTYEAEAQGKTSEDVIERILAGGAGMTIGTLLLLVVLKILATSMTLAAGGWILRTPFALIVILAGLAFDNCIRMIITLNSQYYRLIDLPEASFGLIGSGLAVVGLVMPRVARRMAQRHSPVFNLGIMSSVTLIGLVGMTFFWPVFGLLPVTVLVAVIYLENFFQSHYLNRITDSHQRATVLSFKGLSFNLAYGLIGVLYSLLLAYLRAGVSAGQPEISEAQLENLVFIKSIAWFPGYFLLTMGAVLAYARWRLKNTDEHKRHG